MKFGEGSVEGGDVVVSGSRYVQNTLYTYKKFSNNK